ncbi:MAG: AAA family ATPase [Blautia sp.]|nr:AAA family ATPase [Blautia sp.]
MIIRKLTIKNFGKINNKTFELTDGINVLYGENESGKTTIHTFLKSMLYGISRQRGRAARNDVYTAYEPWENPGQYGGILWFESCGENFRLTRNFSRSRPYQELLSETTGAIADAENGSLERILGDVSEVIYDNTVSVGQLKSVTGQDLVRELQNYMAGYQGSIDSSMNLQKASQMLKMSRKGFQGTAQRRRKEIEAERNKVSAKMEYLEKEIDDLLDRQEAAEENDLQGRDGRRSETVLAEHLEEIRERIRRVRIIFTVLPLLCVLGAVFLHSQAVVLTGLLFLGVVLFLIGLLRLRSLERERRKKRRLLEKWVNRQKKIRWDRGNLEKNLEEKGTDYENLRAEYQEYEKLLHTPVPEDQEVQALTLALETIEELSGRITGEVGLSLQRRTSQILSEITGGKYTQVLMDQNLHMTVNTEERSVSLERLSRGTLEQIYFALRMAAGELFCTREPFPVILDDVFGMYDEERLTGVLQWLHKENRQIIISTCNRREMEILEREDIPYQSLLL